MWSPTHIQVTVQRAKGLLTKGKNGTNNCFVTIGLGKEKYQTSIKEKSEPNVSWNEECELKIPDQGNRAELVLTCLHRNNLAIDEFLGQVTLPLNEMDVYDRPRSKWFKLESKPGKEKKNKERGELEVRVMFTVKSGSLTDLTKKEKHKSSIGSLMSLGGEKRKGMKNFAKSLGSKMNLRSKNKNKDGDDNSSFSGSFVSIGTPNSRRYGGGGQMAGEADPGVISEDEDEFKFDNLSPKSSSSSINMPAKTAGKLRTPTQNYEPRHPSPLLRNGNGKCLGKQFGGLNNLNDDHDDHDDNDELTIIKDEKEYVNDKPETLPTETTLQPTPSKPPRSTPVAATAAAVAENEKYAETEKINEWETKLYGKHLEINGRDSLKRRSWDLNPKPIPFTNSPNVEVKQEEIEKPRELHSSSSTTSSSDDEEVPPHIEAPAPPIKSSIIQERDELISPVDENGSNDFNKLNATFAKFEQRNSSKFFDSDTEEKKWYAQSLIDSEAKVETPKPQQQPQPQAKPRQRIEEKANDVDLEIEHQRKLKEEQEAAELETQRLRAEEDARFEAELRLNEQRLREEEFALQQELKQQEAEAEAKNRREAMRREEDERILSFSKKRSISVEESPIPVSNYASTTPEQSPKQRVGENREKRFGKFKYFNKRDKHENGESSSSSPKSNERIIIGHEKSTSHSDRRSEITAALAKKYEGKSREELMLIANGMENEALIQRHRVKELEDYLDNLLLRVMETHPKILQNPYSRTTSAKSG